MENQWCSELTGLHRAQRILHDNTGPSPFTLPLSDERYRSICCVPPDYRAASVLFSCRLKRQKCFKNCSNLGIAAHIFSIFQKEIKGAALNIQLIQFWLLCIPFTADLKDHSVLSYQNSRFQNECVRLDVMFQSINADWSWCQYTPTTSAVFLIWDGANCNLLA